MEKTRMNILGVQIDSIDNADAQAAIERFIKSGRPHQIVTVNPEFVMRAQKDMHFKHVLNDADLALADGAGLLAASRFIAWRTKTPSLELKHRVTGADLVPEIIRLAAQHGWHVYLLGGLPGMAEKTATQFVGQYPNLKIVGTECGPRLGENGQATNPDQAKLLQDVLTRVKQARPDILLVGFGAPKQDRFIARYKAELAVPVMIGVGGVFEFVSGHIRRAPAIFRLLWLEWLWRLIQQPSRFGRIWTAVVRFPLAIITKTETKKKAAAAAK